ncbi:MAG: hypothetical protein FWD55_08175, partial [Propionibacteriaceae bacterium]|nr:hypothetical protein [Propionibacteriaceae bacterium]
MRWLTRVLSSFVHRVRTSLRYRLVFLTALTIIMAAVIAGVGTYQAARVSLYSQLDLELLAIADRTAAQIATDFEENTISNVSSLSAENVVVILVAA